MGAWLSEDVSPEKLPRRRFLGLLVAAAVASWVPWAALFLRREDRHSDSRRLMRLRLLLLLWATASRAEFICLAWRNSFRVYCKLFTLAFWNSLLTSPSSCSTFCRIVNAIYSLSSSTGVPPDATFWRLSTLYNCDSSSVAMEPSFYSMLMVVFWLVVPCSSCFSPATDGRSWTRSAVSISYRGDGGVSILTLKMASFDLLPGGVSSPCLCCCGCY